MDFGVVSPDTVAREFLAVVLAGFGNELVSCPGNLRLGIDVSVDWFL
jgi:hypothetical protein